MACTAYQKLLFLYMLISICGSLAVGVDVSYKRDVNKLDNIPRDTKEGLRPDVYLPDLPPLASVDQNSGTLRKSQNNAADAPVTPNLPRVVAGSGTVKPKKHMKIADSEECAVDVKRFCSDKAIMNNFVVLDCLQDDEKIVSKLSEACHHFLWLYKLKLTRDTRFDDASNEACAPEFAKFTDCHDLKEGEAIPCLMEHYDKIQSKPCSIFLNKMGSIIFSDYRLMGGFMKDCKKDISSLGCGRIGPLETADDSPHLQGQTVSCLNQHYNELDSKPCKKALQRVAEFQSDDFHLDRPLYYACKGDRENLCQNVVAGEGAVFKCLYRHLGDEKLSDDCRTKLEERQKIVAKDVKADRTFYMACSDDIRDTKCNGDIEELSDYSKSSILLCLEEKQSKGNRIKPKCLQEMFELRSELMQDYKISPELVDACDQEIKQWCNGLKRGGNTLQCLMSKATTKVRNQEKKQMSKECIVEVTKLLQVVNPGENINLDAPLRQVCGEVITKICPKRAPGQGDIITCLLENLDHEGMTDECENELLVIQYFASRDFRLDFHLFRQCQKDAEDLCGYEGFTNPSSMTMEQKPIVFSCLHRLMRSEGQKPSLPCIHEIKRVMRERSKRISLVPEVEEACLNDLAEFCTENNEHKEIGGEMECLQRKLQELSGACKDVITNFTIEESEDIEMDRILMKSCTPMIRKFCGDKLDSNAIPTDVLECLIKHKNRNDMDRKCAAGIEHHQIISLQDFRFNIKFREACQTSVAKFCKNKKTKYDVIACLSEHVRNDTLMEKPQRIEDKCMKQLKFELLQRGETINLDPELKKSCDLDITNFCGNKRGGEGQVVECLRAHKKKLSPSCHTKLFQRERDDAMFGDYTLQHACKKMIEKYCETDGVETDIFNCLKMNMRREDFDDRCGKIVLRRQVERAQDFRLNPHLHKACKMDIPKFCSEIYRDNLKDEELEGKVINCLKKKFASKVGILTKDCEHEIQSRVKEAALNINLNPVLMKTCKTDIKSFCLNEIADILNGDSEESYQEFRAGSIMECLKKNFKSLNDFDCKKEVAFVISESRIDVHVDPLLYKACQQDLITNCREIQQGQGRQMSCLLSYLESLPNSLTRTCKSLLQSRKDLWEAAAVETQVESFSDIYDQMSSSPSRNYFFAILFTIVGIIFIFGITCGRVTKRVRAAVKNK